jgi:hypothetical protein
MIRTGRPYKKSIVVESYRPYGVQQGEGEGKPIEAKRFLQSASQPQLLCRLKCRIR